MTPAEIYNEHLLAGKKLKLQFASQSEFATFRTAIYKNKRRQEELGEQLGFPVGTENQQLTCQQVATDPLTYIVFLEPRKRVQKSYSFQIIEAPNASES